MRPLFDRLSFNRVDVRMTRLDDPHALPQIGSGDQEHVDMIDFHDLRQVIDRTYVLDQHNEQGFVVLFRKNFSRP